MKIYLHVFPTLYSQMGVNGDLLISQGGTWGSMRAQQWHHDFLKEQIKYSTSSNKYGTQNWFCLQCEDFGEIAAWHTRLWFLCTLPLLAYFFSTTCMWFLAIFWSMVSHTIKLGILSSIYIPIKALKSSYTSEREISISKPTWDIIPGLLMPTSSFAYIPPHNFCSS